jgi:hypothetical protein
MGTVITGHGRIPALGSEAEVAGGFGHGNIGLQSRASHEKLYMQLKSRSFLERIPVKDLDKLFEEQRGRAAN